MYSEILKNLESNIYEPEDKQIMEALTRNNLGMAYEYYNKLL